MAAAWSNSPSRPRPLALHRGSLNIMASSGTCVLLLGGDGAPEVPLFGDGFEAVTPAPVP